jgi:signal transduction histidine kinase
MIIKAVSLNSLIINIISYKSVLLIVLLLTCKLGYYMDWKKSFIYVVGFDLIYKIFKNLIHSILLLLYFLIETKLNISIVYFYLIELIIFNLPIIVFAFKFNKLKEIYMKRKYYIYMVLAIIINLTIILYLKISLNKIYDLSDLATNSISVELLSFCNFVDSSIPYTIVGINIVFILVLINSIKLTKENANREVMYEKLHMQHNYYINMKKSHEKARSLYHDLNSHIQNIKALKNNNEEVNKYINDINSKIEEIKDIYETGNVLLDIIVNEKHTICKNENIDFICDINFRKCNFIEMIDITSIFSNLLDNAIEACKKINKKDLKKYINVRGTFYKGYYVVKCENSKVNEVKIKKNKIITSKENENFHGIGLENIKTSVKKYNGDVDIKIGKNKFILSIYIPIK